MKKADFSKTKFSWRSSRSSEDKDSVKNKFSRRSSDNKVLQEVLSKFQQSSDNEVSARSSDNEASRSSSEKEEWQARFSCFNHSE